MSEFSAQSGLFRRVTPGGRLGRLWRDGHVAPSQAGTETVRPGAFTESSGSIADLEEVFCDGTKHPTWCT